MLDTLKKNKEFGLVYSKGRTCSTKLFVMIYLPRRTGNVRVGFTVSKKVGNAVTRNRVRRRLKNAFLRVQEKVATPVYIVFVARQIITEAEFSDIVSDMGFLIEKAHLDRKRVTLN